MCGEARGRVQRVHHGAPSPLDADSSYVGIAEEIVKRGRWNSNRDKRRRKAAWAGVFPEGGGFCSRVSSSRLYSRIAKSRDHRGIGNAAPRTGDDEDTCRGFAPTSWLTRSPAWPRLMELLSVRLARNRTPTDLRAEHAHAARRLRPGAPCLPMTLTTHSRHEMRGDLSVAEATPCWPARPPRLRLDYFTTFRRSLFVSPYFFSSPSPPPSFCPQILFFFSQSLR